MCWMTSLIVNLISAGIGFLLKTVSWRFLNWMRFGGYWGPLLREDVALVLSMTGLSHGDRYTGIEDAQAASIVAGRLLGVKHRDLPFVASDHASPELLSGSHVVSIGGPGSNAVTKQIIDLIDFPIEVVTDSQGHSIGFRNTATEDRHIVVECDSGRRVKEEVGVCVTGPSPFNPDKRFVALFGVHGLGTFGTALFTTRRNIRGLWTGLQRRRSVHSSFLRMSVGEKGQVADIKCTEDLSL